MTGKTINEVAAPAGTGTLSVLLAATDAAADITTITTNMADTQVTAVVTDTMTFTGDFDGANVQVNADVTADATADTINLTTSADRLSGLTVTGVDTGNEDTLNLVITGLASNLSADLNGITGLDSITASFATTGVFAGTLPTDAVITIEDDVVMTTNATNAIAADFVEATPGIGTDGTLTVTVGAADAGANLANINSGAVNPVTVNSITVVENLTFVGTLVNGVRIADGVTMSVAADRIDDFTVNAAGTTGAVTVDATTVTNVPLTLAGSADYTVNALGAALVATAVTGDLDVTTGATDVSIALGAGTNTVNANALTAGQTVTVTGNDTAATIDTVNGNITASGVADADADTTTGGLVLNGGEGQNTIIGSENNDIINGGIDADVLSGGAGNDTFIYDATLDVVTGEQINGGNGIDTIQVNTANAIDFSLATINADVEILDLTTVGISANVTITGTQLNNFSIVNAETADNIRIDELASGVTYDATLATDTFVFVSGSTGQTLATAVTITDFAANDLIQADTGVIAYTEVDGTGRDEATFLAAADANFNGGRDIYVEYNANSSGNAWVMVDMDGDGTVNADDVFIVLTGVNTAGEIDSVNFI